jgi:hypothetical protein
VLVEWYWIGFVWKKKLCWRHSLLFAVMPVSHWSALNTPNFPQTKRSMDPTGQLTEPRRHSYCFRWRLKVWTKWGGVPSCMSHMCRPWWRGTCSKCTGKLFTKTKEQWYTALDSLLGKTIDPEDMITWDAQPDNDSSISQSTLTAGRMLTGIFCFLLSTVPPPPFKPVTPFNTPNNVAWMDDSE